MHTHTHTHAHTYTRTHIHTHIAVTLSGNNGDQFRGFFVQARVAADDTTRTGTFVVVDGVNSRLSSCPRSAVSRYYSYASAVSYELLIMSNNKVK